MKILLFAITVYLVYGLALYLLQRRVLFPRRHVEPETPPKMDGIEPIWLSTGYGKVEAWFLSPAGTEAEAPRPVILFAHGNAELIDFWPEPMAEFCRRGFGVLLVEYPGYGRSEGHPSQETVTEAFVAAYDALAERKDVDKARVVLMGRSLGGGAVCALASKRPAAALVLISTFTSVRSFSWRFLAPGFFVRDPFDNLPVVAGYAGPVLVAHGTGDMVVPYRHGVAVAKAAKRSRMVTYDAGHDDCPPDWTAFVETVAEFLQREGVLGDSPGK
jgi:pimeloyl-ACP methyl ester carboxylesterase